MSKVVTRGGDTGQTHLKGRRVPKTDPTIKLLGQLDKLNVLMGVYDRRQDLQNLVYRMSGAAAGYDVPLNDMESLEREIQSHDLDLIYSKFVRPTDKLHLIRIAVREAEILAWEAGQGTVAKLLNRLSDLYFIRAAESESDYESI